MPNETPELIPRLHYTKNWEDPADYATHQNNEVQNRKDLQSLFTEIATYVNNVMLPRAEQLIAQGGGGGGSGSGGVSGDYLPLSGGAMRGVLYLFHDPEFNLEAATKQYVDAGDSDIVTDMEGRFTAIEQTAEEISLIAQQNGVGIANLTVRADEISATVEDLDGDVGALSVRADAIESSVRDAEGNISTLQQTATSLTSRVTDAEGDISEISQTVNGISLSVSTVTENGEVYSRLTLKIGPNELYGYIKMEGNVDVSGQLSAEALYAGYGEVANLAVDQLTTSRRIVRYLRGDSGDDNFIRIYEQHAEWVTGIPTGGTTQAKSPDGAPLFWPVDVSGLSRGADGYPVNAQQERIFTTTTPTAYPVMVYTYDEAIKRSISFESVNGIYSPIDRFGAGNAQGNNKAWILKTADGFVIRYLTPDNREIGIRMETDGKVYIDGFAYDAEAIRAALGAGSGDGDGLSLTDADGNGISVTDGYTDISGLRKPVTIDFSALSSGSFSETLDGGILNRYAVTRDASGRIATITDASGHVTSVVWG